MSAYKSYFDDVSFQGTNLSAEARTLAEDAARAMRDWIDESVEELRDNVLKGQTALIEALKEERERGVKTLEEKRVELDEIRRELKVLQANLADPDKLRDQAQKLTELTAKADQALKDQIESAKALGTKVGDAAIQVGKKFATGGLL